MNPIARITSAGPIAAAGAVLLVVPVVIAAPALAAPPAAHAPSRVAPNPGLADRPAPGTAASCGAGRFAAACTAPLTGTQVRVPAAATRALQAETAKQLPAGVAPAAAIQPPAGAQRALADDLAEGAAEPVRVPPGAARALAADLAR